MPTHPTTATNLDARLGAFEENVSDAFSGYSTNLIRKVTKALAAGLFPAAASVPMMAVVARRTLHQVLAFKAAWA